MSLFKLSEYPQIPSFNRTASALLKENGFGDISDELFDKLFPDQVYKIDSFMEYFYRTNKLTGTDEFVKKLVDFRNTNRDRYICIFGDYDADGICATSILYRTLEALGFKVVFSIPDRLKDGYGLSIPLAKSKLQEFDIGMAITVDNGISCKDVVDFLSEQGIEVILTDHHIPESNKTPNNCLIIDPIYNRDGFTGLCGAAIALKLSFALVDTFMIENPAFLLDISPLAGIATIADSMPMLEENRYLVRLTLQAINQVKNTPEHPLYKMIMGLGGKYFLESDLSLATEDFIAFTIAPAINAISRIKGNVENLVENIIKIFNGKWKFFKQFSTTNLERQRATNEVMKKYKYDKMYKRSSVFIFDEKDFSFSINGILGLIANKVSASKNVVALIGVEKYPKYYSFSGRSLPGYSLHDGIERIKQSHPELDISGGGHSQAMGINLRINNDADLENFKKYLESDIEEYSEEIEVHIFEYEPELADEIITTLSEIQPFGKDFNKLRFQYTGVFKSFDAQTKLAEIGEYEFKMFISEADANELLGKEKTIIFSINFDDIVSPSFVVSKN